MGRPLRGSPPGHCGGLPLGSTIAVWAPPSASAPQAYEDGRVLGQRLTLLRRRVAALESELLDTQRALRDSEAGRDRLLLQFKVALGHFPSTVCNFVHVSSD